MLQAINILVALPLAAGLVLAILGGVQSVLKPTAFSYRMAFWGTFLLFSTGWGIVLALALKALSL